MLPMVRSAHGSSHGDRPAAIAPRMPARQQSPTQFRLERPSTTKPPSVWFGAHSPPTWPQGTSVALV